MPVWLFSQQLPVSKRLWAVVIVALNSEAHASVIFDLNSAARPTELKEMV